MKETLTDIVSIIDSCAKARKGKRISPIARVHCLYDGLEETFWFTESLLSPREIGDLSKYGRFVPKNSDVAIKIQKNEIGSTFEHKGIMYSRPHMYRYTLENRANFQDRTIAIAGDTLLYQYRNISDFLSALKRNSEGIKDIELRIEQLNKEYKELGTDKQSSIQRGLITKTINRLKEEYRYLTEQQEDLKNITIYIRKQGEMRYSLIVDPIQTSIKTQNLFDGTTLIIDGGPGTGKTTTMIHRLSYLTDLYAIEEDETNKLNNYKLNSIQRNELRAAINEQRDWLFFSPSQRLKEYLADAMKKEGLQNTSSKVWCWKDFCRLILKQEYKIIGEEGDKAPFKVSYETRVLFYQQSGVIGELTEFYLNHLRHIKDNLPLLRTDGPVYQWISIAQNISKRIGDCENYNITQFIQLFNNLESLYSEDCKDLLRDRRTLTEKIVEEICELLDNNPDAKNLLNEIFNFALPEFEDNNESVDSDEIGETDENDKLTSLLKKWLKDYCLNKVNSDIKLSDHYLMVGEIMQPLLNDSFDSKFQKIGELYIFEQFAKYTKGASSIMLADIPNKYKRFRKHLRESKFEGCDRKVLRDISQGKQLHYQEQALLLGFVNTLVKQIETSKIAISNSKQHPLIVAYNEIARPIIGIDEATDFSDVEIYAIQSLLSRDVYSLTLCGDMMQRLTECGIKDWSELNGIVQKPLVVQMKTSYRQSKKLLEVARQLYQDTIHKTPTYKAFMKSNKVPMPLIYVNPNSFEKEVWISKRIEEVYRAYGEQLPSIAIFVNDKGEIRRFIEGIEQQDFFKKVGVKVLDGTESVSNVGGNHICVYPIDVVKGMEFDVVFFHDIDKSSVSRELLKRYIYVGVSRAAFFLAITMSEPNDEIGKYFEKDKDWFKI